MTDEKILEHLEGKLEIKPTIQKKWNQYGVQPLKLSFSNTNDIDRFNCIYQFVLKNLTDWNKISRTPSGGIGVGGGHRYNCRAWDVQYSSLGVMLTIIWGSRVYCVKIGAYRHANDANGKVIYPSTAFKKFDKLCEEHGINLWDYMIDNGAEIKQTIESPMISMKYHMSETDEGLDNCHHIDFHSSYPAGLCNTHPEFRPVIEPIYEKRKEHPENKAILNYTIGWMQSYKPEKGRKAEWAHLSRDAIADNNRRIRDLASILEDTGREVIGYNTDGIWYRGEIYHGIGEGNKLGDWSNDHVNCLFRSKSDGAYEFIENGRYYPVVRGQTKLDSLRSRSEWVWGDIYRGVVFSYTFDIEKGVVIGEIGE